MTEYKEVNMTDHFNTTHGMTYTATYTSWKSMKSRCKGQGEKQKREYKDKGIMFCKRWNNFNNFISDMGIKPDGMELDRIDNSKGYCKENCRWITKSHNISNKTFKRKKGLPRGVHVSNKKYQAMIKIDGKNKSLGVFTTPEKAHLAYINAYQNKYGELPPEERY
jgi:hypothetical protein